MDCRFVNASTKMSLMTLQKTFRGVISVAGGSYASNFIDTLFMKNTIALKQNYPAYAWYEPYFLPNVHYVPLHRDLGNLDEQVHRLLDPKMIHRWILMANTANHRAKAVFNYDFMNYYFSKLFQTYGRRLHNFEFDVNDWSLLPSIVTRPNSI